MRKRLWTVTHAGLTLACVACCAYLFWRDRDRGPDRRGRLSEEADLALRQFQQVRWLGGDYELPPGDDHCAVATLRFEDGRFVGRDYSWTWAAPSGGSRVVPYMVMWGLTPSGPRVVAFSGWVSMSGKGESFVKLDGPIGRSIGQSDIGEVQGYRAIGFAASQELRSGPKTTGGGSADAARAIETHKYVAVLGVKPFATADEARDWAHGRPDVPGPCPDDKPSPPPTAKKP